MPQICYINSEENAVEESNYTFENVITNSWNDGYTGEFRITNTGTETIEDWYLIVGSEDSIINAWNASFEQLPDNTYGFCCPDYAQNIQPGQQVIIGYQANGNAPDAIFCVGLHERSIPDQVSSNQPGTEETNIYLIREKQNILSRNLLHVENVTSITYEIKDCLDDTVLCGDVWNTENMDSTWMIPDFGLALGWNDMTFIINFTDGSTVTEKVSFVNTIYENMENTIIDISDSDGDAINNYFEKFYGTDPQKADTDVDGLNDYTELVILQLDPLKVDTNDDGITDDMDDSDADGLTVVQEIALGTSTFYVDTDGDGLSDGYEVTTSMTSPLYYDTDEDGFSDGYEVANGMNPLGDDSDGDGIKDYEEVFFQSNEFQSTSENSPITKVSVAMSCSGNLATQMYVSDTSGYTDATRNVVGLVGNPVSIDVFATFDTATITFTYDDTKLGTTQEENLCMMWYDEENNKYVLLEDSVCDISANTVTYESTHFSTYMLVDKNMWTEAIARNIDYSVSGYTISENYDFYIIMDYTMDMVEFQEQLRVCMRIIDSMQEGDRVYILYDDGSSIYQTARTEADCWCYNQLDALERLNRYDGLHELMLPTGRHDAMFTSAITVASSKISYAHMFSDAYPKLYWFYTSEDYDSIIDTNKQNIESRVDSINYYYDGIVYPIVIGDVANATLTDIVESYGGKDYVTGQSEDVVVDIQNDLDERVIGYYIDTTDTDGDGIYDVIETRGMLIPNGNIITTDPNKADTDGDGLSDSVEMGAMDEATGIFDYQSDPNDAERKLGEFCVFAVAGEIPITSDIRYSMYEMGTGEYDVSGNEIMGQENLYGIDPDRLNDFEIFDIVGRAVTDGREKTLKLMLI